MKKIITLFTILFLASCAGQPFYNSESEEGYIAMPSAMVVAEEQEHAQISWQEAYATLLRDNYPVRVSNCGNLIGPYRFFLYDMDASGIPELFVISSFEDIVDIYSFKDGDLISLEIAENIPLYYLLRGAARMQINPPPQGMDGFVFMWRWPSAGLFGTGASYRRVVVDWDSASLVIVDYAEWYIDLTTLHELFDNFGFDTDTDILNAAIQEHTHLTINGDPVSEEELRSAFDRDWEWDGFRQHDVDEDNIQSIIFGWQEPSEADETIIFTTTMRIHEDMPEFIFHRKLGAYLAVSYPPSPGNFDYMKRYVSIVIMDEDGNLIQEIEGITQGGHADWMTADHDLFHIQFEDFNFDGYLDMRLIGAINPGTAGGVWEYFWLWNPSIGQFEQNEQLSELSEMANLGVDHDMQWIRVNRRGGPTRRFYSFFEYIDGEFVLAAYGDNYFRVDLENEQFQWEITRTQVKTGKPQ